MIGTAKSTSEPGGGGDELGDDLLRRRPGGVQAVEREVFERLDGGGMGGGAQCGELVHDGLAVAALFEHAPNAARLSLDRPEAGQQRSAGRLVELGGGYGGEHAASRFGLAALVEVVSRRGGHPTPLGCHSPHLNETMAICAAVSQRLAWPARLCHRWDGERNE